MKIYNIALQFVTGKGTKFGATKRRTTDISEFQNNES